MNVSQPIVAGYDGSKDGQSAVEYAAALAKARSLTLRIVHCYAWSPTEGHLAETARHMLVNLVDQLSPTYPNLAVQSLLISRSPAATLIGESRTASTIVVGRRGAGTFGGVHTGAVSRQVASQALCPVVVVKRSEPGGPAPAGTGDGEAAEAGSVVLLVIDADFVEPDTIATAFAEATRLLAPLRVMCLPNRTNAVTRSPHRALTAWRSRHPDVTVTVEEVARSSAPARLLAASREARLLVIGAKAAGTDRGIRIGSLYGPLLADSACTVMIVNASTGDRSLSRQPVIVPAARVT